VWLVGSAVAGSLAAGDGSIKSYEGILGGEERKDYAGRLME